MKLNIQLFADKVDGFITIGTKVITDGVKKGVEEIKSAQQKVRDWKMNVDLKKATKVESLKGKIEELLFDMQQIQNQSVITEEDERSVEDIKKKINDLVHQLEKVKHEKVFVKGVNDTEEMEENVNGINLGLGGIIKKVARWGLAIFGIRSAYLGIRSAIGLLSQSNKKLASDIQYIKWALAKTLEPIITRIVGWAYKLVQAINYLIYRITGVNLLSKSTAKNFKSASGSAKEMQKSLQGFDEANILNKPSGAGGGGMTLPTEDLSKFNLVSGKLKETLDKIAEVLKPIWEKYLKPIGKWIEEKPSRLLTILGGIVGLRLASKIAGILGVAGGAAGAGAAGLLGMLSVLGLLAADVWLIHIVVNSEDYKEVKKQAKGLKEDVKNLNEMVKSGTSEWNENKKAMYEDAKQSVDSERKMRVLGDALLSNIENLETQVEDIQKGRNWLELFDGTAGKTVDTIKTLNATIDSDNQLLIDMAKNGHLTEEQYKRLEERYKIQIDLLKEERDGYRENSTWYKMTQKNIDELEQELKEISKGRYVAKLETTTDKKPVTELEKKINEITTTPHTIEVKASTKSANKSIKGWLNTLGSTLFTTLFPKLNFVTTLAKFNRMGGIVNMPNKGVPITNYAGESGREGIIPMDEEGQMDLIGQSIAKHVVINLTNVTKLDARQIAKETKRISAENDFATNS